MLLDTVDALDIHILVDNTTDMLSTTPAGVTSESAGLFSRGGQMMAGLCLCCAAHGLSCLVTARKGNQERSRDGADPVLEARVPDPCGSSAA